MRRVRLAVLLLIAGLIAAVPGGAQVPEPLASQMRAGRALLIGVANYTDPRWDPLRTIPRELAELQRGLQRHFRTVEPPLINPTVDQLRARLRAFLMDQSASDAARLFVFYAGHGFTKWNENAGIEIGYITGTDTPAFAQDQSGALSRAVSFREIDAMNRESPARHIMMAFDSCFSGALFLTRAASTPAIAYQADFAAAMLRQPVRYFLTAGREDQRVPAASPFATMLLRGLDGDADPYRNNFVTGEDLGRYLRQEIPRVTAGQLTPQYGAIADAQLSRGQFLFATAAAAIRPVPPPAVMPAEPAIIRPPAPAAPPGPPAVMPPVVVPQPPTGYFADPAIARGADIALRLRLVSERRNDITDDEQWWARNQLLPITYTVGPSLDEAPAFVPRQVNGLRLVRAIRANPLIALYGSNFGETRYLLVLSATGQVLHSLDLARYRTPAEFKASERAYVDMAVRWAALEGSTLYFSYGHRTYAASSNNLNAYIAALDLANNRLVWHSRALVSNAGNFIIRGDAIITGYGFTAEPDFLYVLNKSNGRVVAQQAVRSSPNWLVLKGADLHVRAYDTDYIFRFAP